MERHDRQHRLARHLIDFHYDIHRTGDLSQWVVFMKVPTVQLTYLGPCNKYEHKTQALQKLLRAVNLYIVFRPYRSTIFHEYTPALFPNCNRFTAST